MLTEIDCRKCSALCCGPNQSINLNAKELKFFKKSNPGLNQYGIPLSRRGFVFVFPDGNRETRGIYNFGGRCGFLVEKEGWVQCGIHKNPKRPLACSIAPIGGSICKTAIDEGCLKTLKNRDGIWQKLEKSLNTFTLFLNLRIHRMNGVFKS